MRTAVECKAFGKTAGVYGDLPGIAGKAFREIEGLEVLTMTVIRGRPPAAFEGENHRGTFWRVPSVWREP